MLGKNEGTPQVVRQRAPALRTAVVVVAVLIALLAFYVVYEWGRYDAGYDRQAVAQQRTEREVKIEHLEKDNRQMRTKLAELDTFPVGRANRRRGGPRHGRAAGAGGARGAEAAFCAAWSPGRSVGVKIEAAHHTGQSAGAFVVHVSLLRTGGPMQASGTCS
jgi:hypothetical protein